MAETQAAQAPGAGASESGARREVLIVLPGLLLAIMLAMLDQLVVSTALPRIVGDLGGITHLSWVVTAYVLASTVTTPLYGKLGDLYGRKRWLVIAIIIFLIGSALSGLA
jgi:MFS family permease